MRSSGANVVIPAQSSGAVATPSALSHTLNFQQTATGCTPATSDGKLSGSLNTNLDGTWYAHNQLRAHQLGGPTLQRHFHCLHYLNAGCVAAEIRIVQERFLDTQLLVFLRTVLTTPTGRPSSTQL
jgi:hypothetical protein